MSVFPRLPFLCFAAVLCCTGPVHAQISDYGGSSYGGGASTNSEVRLSAIEDQVRSLTGKVEQIDFALRHLEQNLQREQTDTEMRLGKLETAVRAAATAPSAPAAPTASASSVAVNTSAPDEDEDVTGTLGALKMRDGSVTGGVNKQKTPALPATPADYGLTPQEQYDRAFSFLRAASYDEAEKAFKSFMDKNPKDKLVDNAKYWYAETYYVRGKFGDAAVAFAESYEANPKSQKAPDALLKLSMSLGALGKTDDACATLTALKAKFPSAPTTIRARAEQERAHLKCGKGT